MAEITSTFKDRESYYYYKYFALHCLCTFPVICIVIMYAVLIWTLKRKRGHTKETTSWIADSMNKKITLLVQRVVLFLLICYVPYIVWKQYLFGVAGKKVKAGKFNLLDEEVITIKELEIASA